MHRFAIKVPVAPMWCFEESRQSLDSLQSEECVLAQDSSVDGKFRLSTAQLSRQTWGGFGCKALFRPENFHRAPLLNLTNLQVASCAF